MTISLPSIIGFVVGIGIGLILVEFWRYIWVRICEARRKRKEERE